jgi:hypothetical protein
VGRRRGAACGLWLVVLPYDTPAGLVVPMRAHVLTLAASEADVEAVILSGGKLRALADATR